MKILIAIILIVITVWIVLIFTHDPSIDDGVFGGLFIYLISELFSVQKQIDQLEDKINSLKK